jgi:tetratricopeptide (TPR) repeat protein
MMKPDQPRLFHLIGRLRGMAPKRVDALVTASGGSLTHSVRAADVVVLAHSAIGRCLDEHGFLAAPLDGIKDKLISERSFRTFLGISEKWAAGTYAQADVMRVSGLGPEAVRSLALFDVFEGFSNGYTFGDLSVSKRVSRWLSEGYTLQELIPALHQAFRRGDAIGAIEFARLGSSRIGTVFGGSLGDLNGQFLLPVSAQEPDLDQIFQDALEAEEAGDLHAAARLYENASRLDPNDAVIHFNYGNVQSELGLPVLAEVAYRKALALEPAFSEAWFNMGLLAEQRGLLERAKQAYRHAIVSDPANQTAKFNLARLLTSERAYAECVPLWDDLANVGTPDCRMEARKWATLCRLEAKQQGGH